MRVIVDTNVLVRAAIQDDRRQAEAAAKVLRQSEAVAVPLAALCEFVWVLRRVYDFGRDEIAEAMRALLDSSNVLVNIPAAEAGLAMLEAGGDFADAVIEWEGQRLGAETFVSFDRKAISLLEQQGHAVKLLA